MRLKSKNIKTKVKHSYRVRALPQVKKISIIRVWKGWRSNRPSEFDPRTFPDDRALLILAGDRGVCRRKPTDRLLACERRRISGCPKRKYVKVRLGRHRLKKRTQPLKTSKIMTIIEESVHMTVFVPWVSSSHNHFKGLPTGVKLHLGVSVTRWKIRRYKEFPGNEVNLVVFLLRRIIRERLAQQKTTSENCITLIFIGSWYSRVFITVFINTCLARLVPVTFRPGMKILT